MKTSLRSISILASIMILLSFSMFLACSTTHQERTQTPSPSATNDLNQRQLVEKADLTLKVFMNQPEFQSFRDLLPKARGVLIVPQLLQGAFVWGVSGGSGVFFARDTQTNRWNGPAFYTLGGASFGLQIGGEAAQVILLCMSERGVTSFLGNSVKLGGDVSVAVGPVGAGVNASTENLSVDILQFSLAKGLYAGVSLNGAVAAVRNDWNENYYGQAPLKPQDILVRPQVTNKKATVLVQNLSAATQGK